MISISVIMPVFNAESTIAQAISSVLKQSFVDFEFIIVDDGSEDKSVQIINSFKDERIVLLQNKHDFIGSLNKGLEHAKGRYIARMDADDIMHIDRLKIQYEVFEEEPTITVCGSWMTPLVDGRLRNDTMKIFSGLIQNPLLILLNGNMLFHPTIMIRKEFLVQHELKYEPYPYAEDYKLWLEIAKKAGVFYIEPQALLYYRISENQISKIKQDEQKQTADKIKMETIQYLISKVDAEHQQMIDLLYSNLIELKDKDVLHLKDISELIRKIFMNIKVK